MEHNDGTVGIVFKIVTSEKKPTNLETKRLKKHNQTWIKAKSLPQKAYLPLYLKPRLQKSHKRGKKKIKNHLNVGSRKTQGNLLATSQNQRTCKENDH